MKITRAPKCYVKGGPVKGQGLIEDTNFSGKDAQGFPIDKTGRRLTAEEQLGLNRPDYSYTAGSSARLSTSTDRGSENRYQMGLETPTGPNNTVSSGRTMISNDANGNVTYKDALGNVYTLDKSGNPIGLKSGGKVPTKAPSLKKKVVKGYAGGGWVDENGQPITEIPAGYSDKQLSDLGWTKQGTSNSGKAGNLAMAAGTGLLSGLATNQAQKGQDNQYNTYDGTNPMLTGAATAGLNAAVPGAGTALGLGINAKDAAVKNLTAVDPETGKYKNKNKAYAGAGLEAAMNFTPGIGAVNTLLDKDKSFKDKALSIGTMGVFNDADRLKDNLKDPTKSLGQKIKGASALGEIDENEADWSSDITKAKNLEKSQAAISEAMRKRNAGEFAGGGLIKGKGGPKDDAIDAKVKAGSFVVPAENVDKAKEIKKLIMKHAPSLKKANLNQKGGTQVKLSNGEMLISPKEVEKIEDKLGEKVWDKLAPNAAKAEDLSEGEMEEMELAHGGLTPEKARIMLHDGTINGKKITDKQRRYFGFISNGKADGGRVKGESQTQYVARMKKESANKPATKTTTTKVKTAPKTGKTKFEPIIDVNEETIVPGQITDTNYLGNPTKTELSKATYNIPDSTIGTTGATDTPVNTSSGVKTGGKEILDIGTAINYGLPLAQAGIGIKNLLNAGKRPVDKIDPAYNASVERAIGDSRFGFSPEEKFALDQQNQGLTNSQRYNARNLSGGSAANALANERAAINSSYGRGLETTIRGKEIQQEKKRYADSLVADRQEKSRRLFGDTMNAWQQNQQAGAGLLNAGINNLVGASRYNAEKAAQENIEKARTSYLNSF